MPDLLDETNHEDAAKEETMTDHDLNRSVALARGTDITVLPDHDWKRDKDGSIDTGAWDGDMHNGPMCARCGYSFCIHCESAVAAPPCALAIPDVCTSPAAWGALFEELPKAPYHYRVALHSEGDTWLVYIYPPYGAPNEDAVIGYAADPLPGRALAKAYLRSKGVEI